MALTYAVFTYRCGDLQWPNYMDASGSELIGFLGSSFPQLHRLLNSRNVSQEVACANYPNVWNNLVYHLTAGMYVHCYLPVSYCSLYTVKLTKTLAHSVFLVNDLFYVIRESVDSLCRDGADTSIKP